MSHTRELPKMDLKDHLLDSFLIGLPRFERVSLSWIPCLWFDSRDTKRKTVAISRGSPSSRNPKRRWDVKFDATLGNSSPLSSFQFSPARREKHAGVRLETSAWMFPFGQREAKSAFCQRQTC